MRSIIYLMLFFFALPLFSEERKHGGKAIEVKVEAGTKDEKGEASPPPSTRSRGTWNMFCTRILNIRKYVVVSWNYN